MEKLSKKERREAYKKALAVLDSNKVHFWGFHEIRGICHAILATTYPRITQCYTSEIIGIFYEFSLFRPSHYAGEYWFDDKFERQIVLEFCILMTEDYGKKR